MTHLQNLLKIVMFFFVLVLFIQCSQLKGQPLSAIKNITEDSILEKGFRFVGTYPNEVFYRKGGFMEEDRGRLSRLLNAAGNPVTDFNFRSIGDYGQGFFYVKNSKGIKGYIDIFGHLQIQNDDLKSGAAFTDGIARIEINSKKTSQKYALINKKGEIVGSYNEYPIASYGQYQEGMLRIEKNNKIGYLNYKGQLVSDFYDDGYDFFNGMAQVVKGGKVGFINKQGKLVVPLRYDFANSFNDNVAFVMLNGHVSFIDKMGNVVLDSVKAKRMSDHFSEGLLRVMGINGKRGFINKKGELIIAAEFEDARDFSYGLVAIEKAGKWGFMDKEGKIAINFEFDEAYDFYGDFCVVKKGNKRAYINRKGKLVTDYIFDSAFGYIPEYDLAEVAIANKRYVIKLKNN